jgi:hypothetical protein
MLHICGFQYGPIQEATEAGEPQIRLLMPLAQFSDGTNQSAAAA